MGQNCSVKYQTCRRIYDQEFPERQGQGFRMFVFSGAFERQVWDWVVSQFGGVLRALQQDMRGCWERSMLEVRSGAVFNTYLLTQHPHDFTASDPTIGVTEADIDAQYSGFRSKYEMLSERFMRLRERPGNFLYVVSSHPYIGHVEGFLDWLDAGPPEHVSRLLLVGSSQEESQPYSRLGDRVTWTTLPDEVRKPPDRVWEGDDQRWDKVLSGIRLRSTLRHPAEMDADMAPLP